MLTLKLVFGIIIKMEVYGSGGDRIYLKGWEQYMKRVLSVLSVMFLFMMLAGCGREGENAGDNPSHEPLKFGATYMTMDNPYFEALNGNIQEIVEANGDVLITRDPSQNQEKQNEQIQEFLDEGAAAIFVNPVDWKEVVPALEACKAAGVPVFNIDTHIYDMDLAVSGIVSDNYNAGVQIAKDMMKKRDSAKIVIINHTGIKSTNQRVQGFLDTIQGHPSYHVVIHRNTTAELEMAMEVMNSIIERDIEFDVVLGGNDPSALGALAALQQQRVGRDVLIYGIDGSPDAKRMIKEGYLEGSSAQFPNEIGRKAAETAYDYLEGREVEKDIVVPVELITKENLDSFDIAGWQ